MRVAVVGHVEWVELAQVARVPEPGQIVHAARTWAVPGGSGAVAAVQLARLVGEATLYTALADAELGRAAQAALEELGVRVCAAHRPPPQRRAFAWLDERGERTITTLGQRTGPRGDDPLPWEELEHVDACYVTSGDAAAIRAARRARVLVATPRILRTLIEAAVALDALAGSATDADERYRPGALRPVPELVVSTAGGAGGRYTAAEGASESYAAAPLPGPVADAYGCGDSFAAGLTFALGAGMPVQEALHLAARCGATCLTGHGPYERQLTAAEL